MQLSRMSTLVASYQQVIDRIHQACDLAQREKHEVALLAVSKTKPADMVEILYQQGQRAFGENYLQDAEQKIQKLSYLTDIEWHFIGPIQSNKTRIIAEHFDWVETLDRKKIAQRLNDQRPASLPPLKVMIQVNISEETQKSGVLTADVTDLAAIIDALPKLELRGLMCIPSATDDQERLAAQFDKMNQLINELNILYPACNQLSMGMSGDLELAIQHHSTQVRIGTDIFGARETAAQ